MNNKDGLDEMQRERHNRIGSQMFVFMSFTLLINIALHSAGIRWIDYPADTMSIVTVCLGIYLVRLILAGAYQNPRMQGRKTIIITLIIAIIFAVIFAIFLWRLPVDAAEKTEDYSAYILVGISAVALIAAGIAAIVNKKRDETDSGD